MLKEFPNSKTQLKTKKGTAKFIKLDVFKKTMFYLNPENPNSDLLEITINQVKEIIEQNKNGKIPESLAEFITEIKTTELSFEDAMGQDNINRFDNKKQKKKKKKTRNKRINLSKDKRLNKVNQKKMRNYMFAVFVVLLSSCSNTRHESYFSFDNIGWNTDSIISFKYSIEDTLCTYEMKLKIRHTVSYEYQNLFVF